jgi:hypothetical protein
MTTLHHSARYEQIVNTSSFDAWKTAVISSATYVGSETRYTTLCGSRFLDPNRFKRVVLKNGQVSCDRCILLASLIEANEIDISQQDGYFKLLTLLDGK